MMKNKKGIEFGFNWLFAIIVGGVILFLAIYGTGRFIGTQETAIYTQTAAELVSLLDPLETGLASGKSTEIYFAKLSRTFYDCDENNNLPFGTQTIRFSEQTFGEKFPEAGGKVTIRNKYVFAENVVEGRRYVVFSKPFFMSYKVADLLVVSSKDYCFLDAPEDVKDEIKGLNIKNIIFVNATEKCNGVYVCFNGGDCDIKVSEEDSYVQKEGKRLYYIEDLLYAAIFSSSEIYECNVKRLKSKFDELGEVYIDKIDIIERKGCRSNIGPKLKTIRGDIDSSRDLITLEEEIEDIDSINRAAKSGCQLY